MVTIDGESFPVTAISEQYEGRVQFISLEAAERLGEPVFYSVLLSVEPDQQIKLGQKLSEVDGYILASFFPDSAILCIRLSDRDSGGSAGGKNGDRSYGDGGKKLSLCE